MPKLEQWSRETVQADWHYTLSADTAAAKSKSQVALEPRAVFTVKTRGLSSWRFLSTYEASGRMVNQKAYSFKNK